MHEKIDTILKRMNPITLDEMKDIRLMDRIDSKFVAPASVLPELLERMIPYFRVQFHNEKRIAPYTTQYFDTPDLGMFVMHQNGKLNRQKIRIRTYVDSAISFLEVKNKNNKGRTKKVRVPAVAASVDDITELQEGVDFLGGHSLFPTDNLVPSLSNSFNRITLVNNRKTERITIDIDLAFENHLTGEKKSFEQVVILELKQDGWQHSDFREILRDLRIKKSGFSKYCMGTVITNPDIKSNRFKRNLRKINKLNNNN